MNLTKPTSLESTDDVAETLQWKFKSLEAEGKMEEYRRADYIARAVLGLESRLEYIDESLELIKDEKKAVKEQIERIKIDGAKFLADNGVDKLAGASWCSSITITKGREESTEEYTEQEFVLLVSDEEVRELLLALGKAEMRTVVKSKTTAATEDRLRINKAKIKRAEVIEE